MWKFTMNKLNTTNHSAVANQVDKNPLAENNFFVPCVPIAISASLVAAQPLAKRLANSATEFAHLSFDDFASIQLKKSELRLKVDECSTTDEALLDICLLNVRDLFCHLASYQVARGQAESTDLDAESQSAVQLALEQVHAYTSAMDLVTSDYCVDGVIHPVRLFDACLKRVQLLQKRWQDNYFLSIKLALQLQTDAVYDAAASYLTEMCQHGLDNQISLEPVPQAQEDVLVAMTTFVDLPFSGEWPVLRERVIVLGYADDANNAGHEGAAQ
jgi:hypothetical protein